MKYSLVVPVQENVVVMTGEDVHIAEYVAEVTVDTVWRLFKASRTFRRSRGMATAKGTRANAKKAVGTKRP